MSEPSLETKIQRLTDLAAAVDPISRDMVHAYASCIEPDEVFDAVELTIEADTAIQGPVITRLLRICREDPRPTRLADLVKRLLALKRKHRSLVVRVNSILARLIEHLDLQMQRRVIQSWKDDQRKDSMARWLKAARRDPALFEPAEVLEYWRASGDTDAAKLIAYDAPPEMVGEVLLQLVEACDQGWIVGKAALRAPVLRPETLRAIRAKFPATYAYICAMTGRELTHEEALQLIRELTPDRDHTRGLAIWAIGKMGMWQTLEQVRELVPEMLERDTEAHRAKWGYTPVDSDPGEPQAD
jgi:hypothetical protein